MNLTDVVSGELVTSQPGTTMMAVAELMDEQSVGSVAIVDEAGDFIGLVTDRDIVKAVARGLAMDCDVADIMTRAVDTIEIDTELSDAVAWLNATGYRHLPVTDGAKLVGMVSIKDLLWALAGD